MNILKNFAAAAACAAALALPLAAPVAAGEKSDDIVVRSAAAMEQWQADTTRDINRSLARMPLAQKVHPNNAIVEVAFTLGDDGRADNIVVLKGDGNWAARRAAKYAVRSLDTLDEVPVRNRENARFLAQIVFADNLDTHETLTARLEKSNTARFAEAQGDDNPILLGG